MDLTSIFKAYDVRGTYPDQLDETIAERIGSAFATFTEAPAVIVGQDMRVSSPSLAAAFIQGVLGRGCGVIDIGQVSTDALYYASGTENKPGAMFTASHNPGVYNGIKLCLAGAAPVGQETGLAEVKALAEAEPETSASRGKVEAKDVLPAFVDHVLGFVDTSAFRPLRVVVDAANGMAGKMVPPVFDKTPCELVGLFFELDGTFPNHPADPIQIENLDSLRAKVIETKADIGMAFDGDADRVFLVDEKAEPISGSLTTALVASRILAKSKGESVVHNLICSRIVPETVRAAGGKPIRTRVGHSFIKKVMAETGAIFGGEHSGHYYFRQNFRADSGIIAALVVLEALSVAAIPMSELLAPFRTYWNSGELNTRVDDQAAVLKTLADVYRDGQVDWTDGLTVDFPEWWFNARGSNTEPLLRLNVEAKDPVVGEARSQELLDIIRS